MRIAVSISVALISISAIFAADWTQYRGPSHDGISPEKIAKWPESGPKLIWKTPTKAGFSSFAVAGGLASTLVTREFEGVAREHIIVLDANTGKELWAKPLAVSKYDGGGDDGAANNKGGDGPRSTPAFDGGNVYALDARLNLYCFDAKTGAQKWIRELTRDHKAKLISWQNAASPVIEGDLIFLATGAPGKSLLAVNKKTGANVWAVEDDAMTHATPTVGTIHGVPQVIFFTQKGLISCVPTTGKVLWRHPFPYRTSTAASPIIADDIVYCSAGYEVGAGAARINKNGSNWTATEIWRAAGNQLANHWSTPVYKDGYLYGMFQFKEHGTGALKCVDVKTGKTAWSHANFGPGNVTLVGDKLLALTDYGQLVLIQPAPDKYTEITRFQAVTGKCWSTPCVSDGRIYVRSTTEGACYDAGARLSEK
jgi:outer membrane protein assembly factor BamB